MRENRVSRVLALYSAAESDAVKTSLCAQAGFAPDAVTVIDIRTPGAAEATIATIRAAVASRERIIVIDGVNGLQTALVLAQYLHDDYICGDGLSHVCLEVCELLAARKRHSGVLWEAQPEQLERFLADGYIV